jgi:F-type H+-transporting ATPase subunit delta
MKSKVAGRYARALFNLAADQKNLDAVVADARGVKASIEFSADLKAFLANPILKKEEKNSILKAVFGSHVQPLFMNFLMFLVERSRLDVLADIIDEFIAIHLASTGTMNVVIRTERAIDPPLMEQLLAKLQERSGKKIQAEVIIDPQLLGGFKVQMGDEVYDSSFKSQLRKYQESALSTV